MHLSRTAFRPAIETLEQRRLLSGGTFVTQTNLISDGAVPALHVDPNLVNPWGISFNPTGPFWVSDNGAGVVTVYDRTGTLQNLPGSNPPQPFIVHLPGGGGGDAAPTGQVFNPTTDFKISNGGQPAPAFFIFAGEDGGISAWNPTVDVSNAVLTVDQSAEGSIFKGLAIGSANGQNYLYAADFHNNAIDVFDGSFAAVHAQGAFQDSRIPAGFAPFNVQNIAGRLFVTYAKQDADAEDDVAGAGNGFVDEFDTSGQLLMRFDHVRALNSPWGVAQAPMTWGRLAGDILIGQFGSGQIAAFDPRDGEFQGLLRGSDHKSVQIDGLWALTFGNGGKAGDPNTLYFTAGLNGEQDGLFGSLDIHLPGQDHGGHGNQGDHDDLLE